MASARNLFRFTVGIGALSVLAVVAVGGTVLSSLSFAVPSFAELFEACRRLVPAASLADILLTALASLGLASTFYGVRVAFRHHRSRRRLLSRLEIVGHLDRAPYPVQIVVSPQPQAFCFGCLWPRIYLSTGAVSALTPAELDAVIAHETHHAAQRDPLRILVAQALRDALFFLPVMRHAAERYRALAELAADEAAVRKTGDATALASAMLTFEAQAPTGTVGIAPERVDHLLGQPPRWQLSLSLLGLGAVTLTVIAALSAAAALLVPAEGVSVVMLLMQLCALMPVLGGAMLVLIVRRSMLG